MNKNNLNSSSNPKRDPIETDPTTKRTQNLTINSIAIQVLVVLLMKACNTLLRITILIINLLHNSILIHLLTTKLIIHYILPHITIHILLNITTLILDLTVNQILQLLLLIIIPNNLLHFLQGKLKLLRQSYSKSGQRFKINKLSSRNNLNLSR